MACRMPELPAYAAAVLRALEDAGFEAWAVGGWVRDALLGSASHDVDVWVSRFIARGRSTVR